MELIIGIWENHHTILNRVDLTGANIYVHDQETTPVKETMNSIIIYKMGKDGPRCPRELYLYHNARSERN